MGALNRDDNVANLKTTIESIILEIQQIIANPANIQDANAFEKLEIEIHSKTAKLADSISAIKLQETFNNNTLDEAEKKIN